MFQETNWELENNEKKIFSQMECTLRQIRNWWSEVFTYKK